MHLEATNRTPEISISETALEMKGECYPEDITAFAEPILESLAEKLKACDVYSVRLELRYFNSSSAKFLFDFFEVLEDAAVAGKSVSIEWRYRSMDNSMKEAGEDFGEDMEEADYQLVEI
jgi:hypothetical protein